MKNSIKKIIGATGLLAVMTFSNLALSESRGSEVAAELEKELKLTDAQTKSVAKVLDDHFAKIQVIAESKDSRFKKIRSMRSQNGTKNDAMEEILNGEQFEKYTAMMKEKRDELKSNRKQ